MANKLAIRYQQQPQACVICDVKMETWEETAHMAKHHVPGSVQIGDLFWISPHEVIWKQRHHYKPARPS